MKNNVKEDSAFRHIFVKIGQILLFRFMDLEYDYVIMEKRTGMGRAKIRRIFAGEQDMKVSELMLMCNALGVDIEDLLGGGD